MRRFKTVSRAGLALILATVPLTALAVPAPAAAPSELASKVALDWNLIAVTDVRLAKTTDGVAAGGSPRFLYQTEGLLYMSYVQAAVYDATMKITRRYTMYHQFAFGNAAPEAAVGDASPQAAVVAASYNTLHFYLSPYLTPPQNDALTAAYNQSISALDPGKRTDLGIAVGEAAAADIEQLRSNDGRNAPISDACSHTTTPGRWGCTPPPSIQAEQTPWMAVMQPFMLTSDSQFRAPAPPALNDPQYLADLNETHFQGGTNVAAGEHTNVALFWNTNAISQSNRTLRDAAVQYNMDLVDTVRLLAMGNMVMTDAGIACFDSKYTYLFWRPISAISAGGDTSWSPIPPIATPNHPEYPSQHGCVTTALADAIANAVGTTDINVTIYGATDAVHRPYASVQAIEDELVNARVWIGFHFRHSVLRGEALGNSVAAWTMARYFLPTGD